MNTEENQSVSFLRVTFFLPRVGGVAVTPAFPESRFVASGDFHCLQPLGALVEVAIGDQSPDRSPMVTRQFLAKETVSEEHIVFLRFADRYVARVTFRGLVIGVRVLLIVAI